MSQLSAVNSGCPMLKMSVLRPIIFVDILLRFSELLQPNSGTEPRIRALLLSSKSFPSHSLLLPAIRHYTCNEVYLKYYTDIKILQILKFYISHGNSSTSPIKPSSEFRHCHLPLFCYCRAHVSGRSCVWVKDLLMWGSSAALNILRRRDEEWGLLRVPQ